LVVEKRFAAPNKAVMMSEALPICKHREVAGSKRRE